MKIYLVGGAVRDKLLGLSTHEKDWVVVGATPKQMLAQGFIQVGKDFPVFLHPNTKEEYALARKERKTAPGYTGFEFDTSSDVTLEEDLLRRDLTINAIAQPLENNELVQDTEKFIYAPNAREDIKNKILRHVSPAFKEDPVRVLRAARFAARFQDLGFIIAPTTMQLMQEMVESGEVNALVPERVWKELERGLGEKQPQVFFQVLHQCHALKILFPELSQVNLEKLQQAGQVTADTEIRFATLLYGLSLQAIHALCESYRVPSCYREVAIMVAEYYQTYDDALNLSAEQILKLLQATDAMRRSERFMKFLQACQIIQKCKSIGTTLEASPFLMDILARSKTANLKQLIKPGMTGKDIELAKNQLYLDTINELLSATKTR
jgi:tRNA nucleotidyltransferase (CCA-adding enzyme)